MTSFRFGEFVLLPDARRLLRNGESQTLSQRVLDVIVYLVRQRSRAVGRDELLSAVWGRTDVGDAAIAQAILKARRVLGDDADAQHYVRTVARFGYQWVAPTEESDESIVVAPMSSVVAPSAALETSTATHDESVTIPAASLATDRSAQRRFPRIVVATLAAIVIVAVAVGIARWRATPVASSGKLAAHTATPGLILVMPTRVDSMAADDGWMRLGVMALSAQALARSTGLAVVPDETALAAASRVGATAGIDQWRTATGAAIVVSSEARRVGEEWHLDATVFNADGSAQLVSARAADPVAAASALARSLRELMAPNGSGDDRDAPSAEVLALAAPMKAAILEGQNGRALALQERAPPNVGKSIPIVLLQVEALIQLGKPQAASDALTPLVNAATTLSPLPRWLPDAWTALGDAELALGHPAQADALFRRAIQHAVPTDRRGLGLAWRGLGISQLVRNDLDDGEQSYLRARLELEPVGDRLLLARITDGLGFIAQTRGRAADALGLYEQAAAMGAAAGLNETELGSRLNAAQAHEALLHHSVAVDTLRALLPRIRAVDYPALHRFGTIAYTNALVETGAWTEARRELATLHGAGTGAATDAVVDVRLDEAQIDLVLGDPRAAIELAGAVRHDDDAANAPDRQLEATATLLDAYRLAKEAAAARTLALDAAAWTVADARPPARIHALLAQAAWSLTLNDASAAIDRYRQALALARGFATPLLLRDVVLPFAQFQLSAGALDAARETAGLVGPYADDDFDIALLTARVAAAAHDPTLARSYFAAAHRLAGERWTPALDAEMSRAVAAAAARGEPPTRDIVGR